MDFPYGERENFSMKRPKTGRNLPPDLLYFC